MTQKVYCTEGDVGALSLLCFRPFPSFCTFLASCLVLNFEFRKVMVPTRVQLQNPQQSNRTRVFEQSNKKTEESKQSNTETRESQGTKENEKEVSKGRTMSSTTTTTV